MLTFVGGSGSGGPVSAAGELRLPFSDAVKFCILGVSVLLLLLALAILAWQVFRCFSQTQTLRDQDPGNSELLYSDKPAAAGRHSAALSTSVEDVGAEALRLSRCLSQASFPAEPSPAETRDQRTDEKVSGSLSFSVYLDQLQSRLVVTVLQVEGLQNHNRTASLQLFVKLRLMWAGSEVEGLREQEGAAPPPPPPLWSVLQEWRSRIVKGSCQPLFGDQFSYSLQGNQNLLNRISLRMEVRDFDKFSRHTVLGEVRVPLDRLNITYPLELQEDLQTPQKDLVGEVLLSLRFLPTSQRLEVGLLKVRTAPPPEVSSETALYARISLQCNQSRSRYQKTSCVARCPVTVFNEVLMFSLPDPPLLWCQISVSVFEVDTSGKSSKRLIGQLSVGKEKNSEDQHWVLMVRSVRQPVARWHRLLL